ncbi:hypothetical protein [Lactobacillus intestinalis]|uniref:hypothetical protein n=1 Tax=Lactobacillus intestinalis TaxID=151781 RepID=UPI0025A970B1|nr:hypothetical protein [Lactobacillus intestinalis]
MTLIKNGKEVESIIMGGTRFDAIANNVGKHMTYGMNKTVQTLYQSGGDELTRPSNGISDTTSIVGYAVINNIKYLVGYPINCEDGAGVLGMIQLSDVTITN